MLFSSLIFLWLFLPIVLILYFISKEKFKNIILLLASIFFYAWGEPVYVLVMLFSIIFNYIIGLKIATSNYLKNKIFFIFGIFINILLLGFFKYYNFLIENINYIFNIKLSLISLSLPIGISFYTFQSISYLVDVYKKQVEPQKNILNMGLFISFFPQLIAGPIIKYYDINEQINNRIHTIDKFNEGCRRFLIGLAKKVLISNILAKIADDIFSLNFENIDCFTAWIGILSYTMQIYFDFSGYSDMAIGLGKIFGFNIKENFNYPYLATSIKDFWRKWHISLSSWFKEYIYIPLGGNKCSVIKNYRNIIIVFFLTGLWHGASWNFIIWGLIHGFFSIFERLVNIEKILKFKFLQHIYTMFIVIIAWVFFRADNLTLAFKYLKAMFNFKDFNFNSYYFSKEFIIFFALSILCCGVLNNIEFKYKNKIIKFLYPFFYLFIAIISIFFLVGNTYNPFIYFRF